MYRKKLLRLVAILKTNTDPEVEIIWQAKILQRPTAVENGEVTLLSR